MKYHQIMTALMEEPLLLTPASHASLVRLFDEHRGLSAEEFQARREGVDLCGEEVELEQMEIIDGIAHIPIGGPIGKDLGKFEKGAGAGMVVMLGPSPHTCNTTDLCGLAMMSSLLDRAIQAQTLARQLESTCRDLDSELQAAADVQRWLLPPATPVVANTGIAAWYRTARH